MNERCPHCGSDLISDREKYIKCCSVCRRFGLLMGFWPEQTKEKEFDKISDVSASD